MMSLCLTLWSRAQKSNIPRIRLSKVRGRSFDSLYHYKYIYIYSFALASLWIFTFFTLVSKSGVEVMELVWMAGTASALRNNLSSAWSLRLQMVIVVTSSLPWTSVDIRGPFPLSLLSLPFEHFWRAFFDNIHILYIYTTFHIRWLSRLKVFPC